MSSHLYLCSIIPHVNGACYAAVHHGRNPQRMDTYFLEIVHFTCLYGWVCVCYDRRFGTGRRYGRIRRTSSEEREEKGHHLTQRGLTDLPGILSRAMSLLQQVSKTWAHGVQKEAVFIIGTQPNKRD